MIKVDWKKVKGNLEQIGVDYQDRSPEPELANFIGQCGYDVHPMIVNLEGLETVNAQVGVIATSKDEKSNNGVYIFCILDNKALGLVTVIPSTISKGPMVRRVTGDITNALTGLELPVLSPFDMIEVTGQVIANTVMRDLITAYNIPKEAEHTFITMYLPKFLANVALYYTGAADKDKKPLVLEEIADMEPYQIRQMIAEGGIPKIFRQEEP